MQPDKPAQRSGPRSTWLTLSMLAVVIALALLVFFTIPKEPRDQPADQSSGSAPATVPGQAGMASREELVGRWQRADGDYLLEIAKVHPDGRLDAAYYNPRPIKVFKAESHREGSRITLHIELRDVNYPGSNYRLTYRPESQTLVGRYFQATEGNTYDVEFVKVVR